MSGKQSTERKEEWKRRLREKDEKAVRARKAEAERELAEVEKRLEHLSAERQRIDMEEAATSAIRGSLLLELERPEADLMRDALVFRQRVKSAAEGALRRMLPDQNADWEKPSLGAGGDDASYEAIHRQLDRIVAAAVRLHNFPAKQHHAEVKAIQKLKDWLVIPHAKRGHALKRDVPPDVMAGVDALLAQEIRLREEQIEGFDPSRPEAHLAADDIVDATMEIFTLLTREQPSLLRDLTVNAVHDDDLDNANTTAPRSQDARLVEAVLKDVFAVLDRPPPNWVRLAGRWVKSKQR